MLQPEQNGRDCSERQKAAGLFLVSGGQSAALFEPVVEPFDAVALAIGGPVEARAMPRLVGQAGDDGADVALAAPAPNRPPRIARIARVTRHGLRAPPAAAAAARNECAEWVASAATPRRPVALATGGGHAQAERAPPTVGADMQAGSSAPRRRPNASASACSAAPFFGRRASSHGARRPHAEPHGDGRAPWFHRQTAASSPGRVPHWPAV